jgi:hypothetical protein
MKYRMNETTFSPLLGDAAAYESRDNLLGSFN